MAGLAFQAKITLNNAIPTSATEWQIFINLSDAAGVFNGSSIQVNDVVIIDTGDYETGTITHYEVKEVTSVSLETGIELVVEYLDYNTNTLPNPDLTYAIGYSGAIVRPTTNRGLLTTVDFDSQQVPSKFTFNLLNHNLRYVIDNIEASAAELGLVTAKELPLLPDGTALLPSRPHGDFVLNQAIVYLNDGSVVDLTDIECIEVSSQFYVKLPEEDLDQYSGTAVSVTVSYLTIIV